MKPEYKEGAEALSNFKETAKKIFQVSKTNAKPEKKPDSKPDNPGKD